jgi:hypothetical protein
MSDVFGRVLRFARLWPSTRPLLYNLNNKKSVSQSNDIHTRYIQSTPFHRPKHQHSTEQGQSRVGTGMLT